MELLKNVDSQASTQDFESTDLRWGLGTPNPTATQVVLRTLTVGSLAHSAASRCWRPPSAPGSSLVGIQKLHSLWIFTFMVWTFSASLEFSSSATHPLNLSSHRGSHLSSLFNQGGPNPRASRPLCWAWTTRQSMESTVPYSYPHHRILITFFSYRTSLFFFTVY